MTDVETLYDERARTYSAFGNGAIGDAALRLLPAGGSVLDIGCASGGLLRLLRARAEYAVGIEVSPVAAARAGEIADRVVCAPIEEADLPGDEFDLVVMADVLEHLPDPAAALGRAVGWVRPGGALLISVPNVAHWKARLTLLRGEWPADPSGTFDATHLRWFTVERLRSLLAAEPLDEVRVEPIVPRLRNSLPWLARSARAEGVIEPRWQALGAARPGLMGYQLMATARRSR